MSSINIICTRYVLSASLFLSVSFREVGVAFLNQFVLDYILRLMMQKIIC